MIKALSQTDERLLEGVLSADNQRINAIYDLVLPSIISWVKDNNGTESDARDIFQEALIALFRKLEKGDFELTCTLKSFLRIMCRNLWLVRLRNNKKMDASPIEEKEHVDLGEDLISRLEQSEKEQLFFKHFDSLGEKCQQILQWFFEKVPLKEIAQKLDTSESYIKKRKFICKEKLVKAVQADPVFEELRSD